MKEKSWYAVAQFKKENGNINKLEYNCGDKARAIETVRRMYDEYRYTYTINFRQVVIENYYRSGYGMFNTDYEEVLIYIEERDTNWTYRYLIQDGDSVVCDDQQTHISKEEAMWRLKIDYARDSSKFKTTEAFLSDSRAWRSTEDGLHIQYDVFNVESK